MNPILNLACALPLLAPQTPDSQAGTRPAPPPVESLDIAGLQPAHRVGRVLLGGQPSLEALQLVKERGVERVVDLRLPEEERGFDQALLLEELGLHYERLGFGGATPLSDEIFDGVRRRLAEYAGPGETQLLVHCASANRVGAVWLPARVLDQGVPLETALGEARRIGLRSAPLEEAALNYVLGAGKQELGAVKFGLREAYPGVARITAAELEARLARPGPAPLLLDVRQPAEYDVSHLRGALRASSLAEAKRLLGDSPREREIVVYCSVGARSAGLADELTEDGYIDVRNLEGSIFEWANTGRPVYRGDATVRVVHPYDEDWGRLLDAPLRFDAKAR